MSAPDVVVHTELDGDTHLVGHLWIRESRRGTFGATFQYADSWLEYNGSFAVDPLLPIVSPGPYHKERLFGAIADSAPDRWGRTLMSRAERFRAKQEARAQRHLREIDYVLGVADVARQGALRFSRVEGGDFLASDSETAVPPMVDLPKLLAAAQGFLEDPDSEEDLRILLAPGSSLGGARPKASVRDNTGQLSLAKFPKKDDLLLRCGLGAPRPHPGQVTREFRQRSRLSSLWRISTSSYSIVLTEMGLGGFRFSRR